MSDAPIPSREEEEPLAAAELDRDEPSAALRALTDEASAARPRAGDAVTEWGRLEARLSFEDDEHPFAGHETSGTRIRPAGPGARPSAPVSPSGQEPMGRVLGGPRLFLGVAALAAAAAVAMWFSGPKPPGVVVAAKSYPPIVEVSDTGTRTIALGEVLAVGPEKPPRWIAASGRLRIRIAGGTTVRLLENGERILLALDHGEIGADVTPVPGGEPLAIDVGSRRVAVHGTRFELQRADVAVDIAVSDGVVVFGWPKGSARTEGLEVKAGQLGNFVGDTAGVVSDPIFAKSKVDTALKPDGAAATVPSLLAPFAHPTPGSGPPPNGHPTLVGGNPAVVPVPLSPGGAPAGPSTSAPPVATLSASATAPVVPSGPPAPPPGLSDTQGAPTLGKMQLALESCLTGGAIGPQFTIETTMTVVVTAAGTVESWAFDPPLDPSLRECARKKTTALTFPTASSPTTFKRPVVLGKK